MDIFRAAKKACTSRGGSSKSKTSKKSRGGAGSSSSFTHISESSPENLNVDYEQLQENYGIDDNLDDIQSPDNIKTPPATPGNASQTQNTRGRSW